MSKLITKHEMFCQEYMSNGFNATKAYQAVYKVEYKQAESNASRLMGNDKIKNRLDELKKEHQQKFDIKKEDLLKDLVKIKNDNIEDAPPFSMKAIEIINKMMGFDAPIKQNISISEQPFFNDDEDENI